MYRGICAHCGGPVTDIGDKLAAKWIHDEGRVWPFGWDHTPAPRQVVTS